jgi:ribonuclease PH
LVKIERAFKDIYMPRLNNRRNNQLRPIKFTPHFTAYAEGSVLIEMGNTRVLCNATIEDRVPAWREESGGGWLTADYAMLPRATHRRVSRRQASEDGRSQEIRRLIGRALRAVVDVDKLGSRTLILDCDVIQADGGTRTASITGGYVAVALALQKLIKAYQVPASVLTTPVAAVSVGRVGGELLLDLCYEEDATAEVDFNVVMTSGGKFVEMQGAAERSPFDQEILSGLIALARQGLDQLLAQQAELLAQL